jgi:hypothetical protein
MHVPLLSHSCHMSRPPHPPRLYNSNYTWRRVQIMKILIMQLSPPSRHSIPLWSKYSPQHPVFKLLQNIGSIPGNDMVLFSTPLTPALWPPNFLYSESELSFLVHWITIPKTWNGWSHDSFRTIDTQIWKRVLQEFCIFPFITVSDVLLQCQ